MRESSPQGMAWRGLRLPYIAVIGSGVAWDGVARRRSRTEDRVHQLAGAQGGTTRARSGPPPRNSSRIVATSGPWTCSGSATASTSVAWAVTSRIGVGAKLAKDRTPLVIIMISTRGYPAYRDCGSPECLRSPPDQEILAPEAGRLVADWARKDVEWSCRVIRRFLIHSGAPRRCVARIPRVSGSTMASRSI
jgi:hypothetical protein